MTDEEFIELTYEIAFGDSAIDKDYSHEQIISRLREFSDNSDVHDRILSYVLEKRNEINWWYSGSCR